MFFLSSEISSKYEYEDRQKSCLHECFNGIVIVGKKSLTNRSQTVDVDWLVGCCLIKVPTKTISFINDRDVTIAGKASKMSVFAWFLIPLSREGPL